MSNRFCPNCGAENKDNGKFCEKCGGNLGDSQLPNTQSNKQQKKSGGLPAWAIVLIVIFGLGFLGAIFSDSDESSTNTNDSNGSNSSVKVKNVDISSIEYENIWEGKNVIIKTTSYKMTGSKLEIGIYIENNSSLNLGFNAHSYGVNGLMTGNNIYDMDVDVAAGKKANTKLTINKSFLKDNGISTVKYIDVLFWAYDNDKSFKEFETDVVRIKTKAYEDNEFNISGEELYNKSGLKVDYLSKDGDNFKYCLTNTTGNYIDFTVENIVINDYTVSDTDFDLFDEQLLNNNQYIFTIKVSNDFKDNNSITKVENIQFTLKIEPGGDVFKDYSTKAISKSFN